MTPLSFLHHGGRACGGMSCVRFLGKWRQRERGKKATAKEGKKNLLTLPLRVCRKKMANSAIKTTPFASSFFNST
jgi:hypothetical protein